MSILKPHFLIFFSENKKVIINGKTFWTVKEMADKLGVKPNTVKQRLFQAKIEPASKDAIYEDSALDAIRDIQMGRPKKAAAEPPEASPTKSRKSPKRKD